jgi:hypothetical protein
MSGAMSGGLQTGRKGPGRPAKGGHKTSIRFRNEEVWDHANEVWAKLGFPDFGEYVDFMFNLAHGRWQEYGFASREEAMTYLRARQDGAIVPPPHLLAKAPASEQETLPLIETTAA